MKLPFHTDAIGCNFYTFGEKHKLSYGDVLWHTPYDFLNDILYPKNKPLPITLACKLSADSTHHTMPLNAVQTAKSHDNAQSNQLTSTSKLQTVKPTTDKQ